MPGSQSDSFKGPSGNTPLVPTWMQNQHEHLPPAGCVQALPTIQRDDDIAEGVETIRLTDKPAIIRAMNLIREDNGGPSWPPVAEPLVSKVWEPYLGPIEDAIANLDDRAPAWEDPEPGEGYLSCELYTFCNGESTIIEAMTERSPELRLANAFLNDFFEGWSYGLPAWIQ